MHGTLFDLIYALKKVLFQIFKLNFLMKKIDIVVTLGPASINKQFLNFINNKASLARLNMSHVKLQKLEKRISFIKKYCSVPICIDTEGAQIRIKFNKVKLIKLKKKERLIINKQNGKFNFYPMEVFNLLKKNDILDVGFEGLQLKILSKNKNIIKLICTKPGTFGNNKGVHLKNRKIDLSFVTDKDLKAIEIAKKFNIKNFALSFTNSKTDMMNFSKLLPTEKKFFKIETARALKCLDFFFKNQKNFLIDRGDLSKDIGIENIPTTQRHIFKKSKKYKNVKVALATNFLESMIKNPYPTRAEANDIYNSLEMGASALVLAGETAMGKYPIESVKFLSKIIKVFKKNKKLYV